MFFSWYILAYFYDFQSSYIMSISVLTCVKGEPESLFLTFESIKPWLSEYFKWTIKFSNDASTDFINKFNHPNIKLHQEEDSSLYIAMNQCLKVIDTDYYLVLGAGDTLSNDGMSQLYNLYTETELNSTSYFAPIYINSSGQTLYPDPNSLRLRMSCPHPSSILKVSLSLELKGYDLSYQIASDYDNLCKYVKKYGNGQVLNIPPLVSFASGGMSELRAFEGLLEEELVRMRVWNDQNIAVCARLLSISSINCRNFIDQIMPLLNNK